MKKVFNSKCSILLFFLVMMAVTLPVAARGEQGKRIITGKVTDAANNEPLISVSII